MERMSRWNPMAEEYFESNNYFDNSCNKRHITMENSFSLRVKVPPHYDEEAILLLFSKYGDVLKVNLLQPHPNYEKVVCFVMYATKREAILALEELEENSYGIEAEFSHHRKENPFPKVNLLDAPTMIVTKSVRSEERIVECRNKLPSPGPHFQPNYPPEEDDHNGFSNSTPRGRGRGRFGRGITSLQDTRCRFDIHDQEDSGYRQRYSRNNPASSEFHQEYSGYQQENYDYRSGNFVQHQENPKYHQGCGDYQGAQNVVSPILRGTFQKEQVDGSYSPTELEYYHNNDENRLFKVRNFVRDGVSKDPNFQSSRGRKTEIEHCDLKSALSRRSKSLTRGNYERSFGEKRDQQRMRDRSLNRSTEKSVSFSAPDDSHGTEIVGSPRISPTEAANEQMKCPDLPHGVPLHVLSSHLESPAVFWVVSLDNVGELTKLEEKLATGEKQPNDSFSFFVNDYCIAKFEGSWYRGKITKVNTSGHCEVYFVDYGNTAEVYKQDIRSLPENFCKPNALATKCRVQGAPPFEIYANEQFWIISRGRQKDSHLVEIFKQSPEISNTAPVASQVQTLMPNPVTSQISVSSPNPITSSSPEIDNQQPSPKADTMNNQQLQPRGRGRRSSDQVKKALGTESNEKVAPKPVILPSSVLDTLSVGDRLTLTETLLIKDDPPELWCLGVRPGEEETATKVFLQLDEFFANGTAGNFEPDDPSELVAAKSAEDGVMYRMYIADRKDGQYTLYSVDYGFCETLPRVYKLPEEIRKFLCRAVLVQVDQLFQPVDKVLASFATKCSAVVKAKSEDKIVVELLSENDSVMATANLIPWKKGLDMKNAKSGVNEISASVCTTSATVTSSEVPTLSRMPKFTYKELKSYDPLQGGDYKEVFLLEVKSPDLILTQSIELMQDIGDNLKAEVKRCCESLSEPYDPVTDELVCARFHEDNLWYRAVVLEKCSEGFRVEFLDYGNVEVVNRDFIKELDPSLITFPPIVLKVSVKSNPQVVVDAINREHLNTIVKVKIVDSSVCPLVVEFFNSHDEPIGKVFTHAEHAHPVSLASALEPVSSGERLMFADLKRRNKQYCANDSLKCEITDVVSPTCIHIMLQELESSYIKLSGLLNSMDNDTPVTVYKPVVGEVLCAVYQLDNGWYRACVKEVNAENVVVEFVDYGNTEVVSLNQLKPVPKNCASCPVLLTTVSITSDDVVTAMCLKENYVSKPISINIVDPNSNPLIVQFKKEDGSLLCALSNDVSTSKPSVTAATMPPTTPATTPNRVKLSSEGSVGSASTSSRGRSKRRSTGKPSPQKVNGIYIYGSVPRETVDIGKLDLHVAEVLSPSLFFGVKASSFDELNRLEEEINIYCASKKGESRKPLVGEICLAKSPLTDLWRRAACLKENPPKFKLLFVDCGMTEDVDPENIRTISADFLNFPLQFLHCKLSHIDGTETFSEDVVDQFSKSMTVDILTVNVVSFLNDIYSVEVPSLEREFRNLKILPPGPGGHDVPPTEDRRPPTNRELAEDFEDYKKYRWQNVKRSTLPLGDSSVVFYGVVNPVEMYCPIPELVQEITSLTEAINEYCLSMPEGSYNPHEDEVCLVKFSEDGKWYRAYPTRKFGNSYEMFFVDFGNREKTTPQNIRKIRERFLKVPFAITRCSLKDFANNVDHSEEVIQQLRDLLTGNNFIVRVIAHKDDHTIIEIPTLTNKLKDLKIINDTSSGEHRVSNGVVPKVQATAGGLSPRPAENKDMSNRVFLKDLPPQPAMASGQMIKVFLGLAIRDPKLIQVQLLSLLETILVDFAEVITMWTAANNEAYSPMVNEIVCAQDKDGVFYRAVVLETSSPHGVKVNFIDYGNESVVSSELIRSHPPTSELHPKLSVPVVPKINAELLMELLNEKYLEKVIDMKVLDPTSSPVVVEFYDEHENILGEPLQVQSNSNGGAVPKMGSSVSTENQASSVSPSGSVVTVKSNVPQLLSASLPIGQKVDIVILITDESDQMYCVDSKGADIMVNLGQKIKEDSSKFIAESSYCPKLNELCLVKYSDGEWYRAFATEINGDNYNMYFVDYGNSEVISPVNIRQINDQFLNIPLQAVKCRIQGCEDLKSNPAAMAKMREFIYPDATVEALVLSKEKDVFVIQIPTLTEALKPLLVEGATSSSDEDEIVQCLQLIESQKDLQAQFIEQMKRKDEELERLKAKITQKVKRKK